MAETGEDEDKQRSPEIYNSDYKPQSWVLRQDLTALTAQQTKISRNYNSKDKPQDPAPIARQDAKYFFPFIQKATQYWLYYWGIARRDKSTGVSFKAQVRSWWADEWAGQGKGRGHWTVERGPLLQVSRIRRMRVSLRLAITDPPTAALLPHPPAPIPYLPLFAAHRF